MNVLYHLKMSSVIRKTLEKELKIKIDKTGFMYGNIKPDLAKKDFKIPHYKEKAAAYIKHEIDQLINTKNYHLKMMDRDFSIKLGVVAHYIADFFCHAHSRNFNGSFLKHILYESNLFRFFFTNRALIKSLHFSVFLEWIDPESVFWLLDNKHKKYLSAQPSLSLDVVYSLRASINTLLLILNSMMLNSLSTAA